ncbi:MAG: hypothetical protein OXQ31_16115 [Spirochaetaceae bacterium]|nr:hypothetical protein [Spirochaetaceae bacterium]
MLTRERLNGMWAGPPVPWTDDDRFRVRDPYPSATPEHGRELRAWMAEHTPALLRLD